MANPRVVLAVIAWVILVTLVCFFLQFIKGEKSEELRMTFKDRIAAVHDNILYNLGSSRTPPLSTVDLEENLKLYVRNPFISFTRDDWEEFWDLLYAKVPEDESGWPTRKSQFNREEAQIALADYYGEPFSRFTDSQWSVFWRHALKGKVF